MCSGCDDGAASACMLRARMLACLRCEKAPELPKKAKSRDAGRVLQHPFGVTRLLGPCRGQKGGLLRPKALLLPGIVQPQKSFVVKFGYQTVASCRCATAFVARVSAFNTAHLRRLREFVSTPRCRGAILQWPSSGPAPANPPTPRAICNEIRRAMPPPASR